MRAPRGPAGSAPGGRPTPLVVLPVLALLCSLVLAGCGNETEAYCTELEGASEQLATNGEGGSPDVEGTLATLESLREASPEDLRDEWDTVAFAWEGLSEAFDRAGVDPETYDPTAPPESLTDAQTKAIGDAAAVLVSDRVLQAGRAIEQHARDVCEVDLGL